MARSSVHAACIAGHLSYKHSGTSGAKDQCLLGPKASPQGHPILEAELTIQQMFPRVNNGRQDSPSPNLEWTSLKPEAELWS